MRRLSLKQAIKERADRIYAMAATLEDLAGAAGIAGIKKWRQGRPVGQALNDMRELIRQRVEAGVLE